METDRKYTIFETFAGAGGSYLGFKNNGFIPIFINDISKDCIDTLLINNPEIKETAYISTEDITKIDADKLLNKLNIKPNDLDVMFGGIVCKGFSLAGERSPNDFRNNFYRTQLKFVKIFKPKISIIENVPGILNAKILKNDVNQDIKNRIDTLWKQLSSIKVEKTKLRKNNRDINNLNNYESNLKKQKKQLMQELVKMNYLISVQDDILNIYKSIGYVVYIKILNSACFGSSTKRDRAIIVAIRNDIKQQFVYPNPIYINEHEYKTVNDTLKLINYNINDEDNIPMKHNLKTIERFKYVKEGESLSKKIKILPNDLKISAFYSRGSTMRLNSKTCAPTLVPGHSNFPIHPFEHRCITVREAATITGFPLHYKFIGSHTKRCEQVGNAVPPALSSAIAKQCKVFLDMYYNT